MPLFTERECHLGNFIFQFGITFEPHHGTTVSANQFVARSISSLGPLRATRSRAYFGISSSSCRGSPQMVAASPSIGISPMPLSVRVNHACTCFRSYFEGLGTCASVVCWMRTSSKHHKSMVSFHISACQCLRKVLLYSFNFARISSTSFHCLVSGSSPFAHL